MYRLSRYQWYRSLCGGHWVYSRSCGWFPVSTKEQADQHMREMPHVMCCVENHSYDDALLQGILVAVAIVCAVIAVGLSWGVIPS